VRTPADPSSTQHIWVSRHLDQTVQLLFDGQVVLALSVDSVPLALFVALDDAEEDFAVRARGVSALLELFKKHLRGILPFKLVPQGLDFALREPVLLFLLLAFLLHLCALLLRLFNPVQQRLLNKDLASIQDETLALLEGGQGMDHGLLVDAFQRMRCNYSFDLLSESEGHEFGDAKMKTTSKSHSEIDAESFSIRDVDEEVFKMSITYTQQVADNTAGSNALDKLVFDSKECR